MNASGFLDRFVHPRLAAVATAGVALWVLSFALAAVGVAVGAGTPVLHAELMFASGLVGLLGTLLLAACVLWLAGLRARTLLGEHVG